MMVFKWTDMDAFSESGQISITVCARNHAEAHLYLVNRLKEMKLADIAHHHRFIDFMVASPRWIVQKITARQKPGHWKTEILNDPSSRKPKRSGAPIP